MRSLYMNSVGGGGGGGGAGKEVSDLVSASPGKGKRFAGKWDAKFWGGVGWLSLWRAAFEGRSKADVSGDDLRSELALRFFGGGGVLRAVAGGVTTLARFLVGAASSSNADRPVVGRGIAYVVQSVMLTGRCRLESWIV